jgi:hypothetical protein
MTVYRPGGTENLVTGELQNTEGSKKKVKFYFNPKEITIDKTVPWKSHENTEGDSPALEFTAGQPKTLACELMFDMFEEAGDVHATYISELEKFALIDSSNKRPPLVQFYWGSNFPVFKGVIENLNVKYTLFLPDGTPCRATVNLKMKQANKLMNKKEAEAANKKAAEKKGTTTQDGETADKVGEKTDQSSRDAMKNAKGPTGQPVEPNPDGTFPAGTHVQSKGKK